MRSTARKMRTDACRRHCQAFLRHLGRGHFRNFLFDRLHVSDRQAASARTAENLTGGRAVVACNECTNAMHEAMVSARNASCRMALAEARTAS